MVEEAVVAPVVVPVEGPVEGRVVVHQVRPAHQAVGEVPVPVLDQDRAQVLVLVPGRVLLLVL